MENAANIDRIDPWLQILWDRQGSDLLLATGSEPRIRVDGKLSAIEGTSLLTGEQIDEIVRVMLSPEQDRTFNEQQDVDFSITWRDLARLRGSAFTQKGETALALRMIPSDIPTFDELGLPPVAEWMARLPRGLVLLTGPTGSGKSTTLASIIARINQTRSVHILTIEDPDRVRPQARALGHHAARGRDRQPVLRAGASLGPA